MQERTLRRSICSGVITFAGAPSWVLKRGLFDLNIFRRMMRLLSASKNSCRGKIEHGIATPRYSLEARVLLGGRVRTCYLRLRGALPDEPVPCATGRKLLLISVVEGDFTLILIVV
jgi:hypothetical protein